MKRFSTAYLLLGILCSAAVFLIGAPSRALGAEVEHYEPLQVHVQLEKVYLDGDVSIEHKHEKVFSMDDFWAAYAGWTLVEQKGICALPEANGRYFSAQQGQRVYRCIG